MSDVSTRFLVRLVGLHSVTSMSSLSAPVGGGYRKAHLKNPATNTGVGEFSDLVYILTKYSPNIYCNSIFFSDGYVFCALPNDVFFSKFLNHPEDLVKPFRLLFKVIGGLGWWFFGFESGYHLVTLPFHKEIPFVPKPPKKTICWLKTLGTKIRLQEILDHLTK